MEVVSDLEGSGSVDRVEAVCNDAGTSDYLVVYLRLLISAHLQKNAEFFSFFIEGGRTVEEFCKQVRMKSTCKCSRCYKINIKYVL